MKRSIIIKLSFKKMLFEEAEGSKNQGKLSGLWTKEIITDKKISFQKIQTINLRNEILTG